MNFPGKTPMQRVAEAISKIQEISIAELESSDSDSFLLIDVREPQEHETSNISTSINVPRGVIEFEIMKHCQEKGVATKLVLYCRTGGRSALAVESLQDLGFSNISSLAGGYLEWQNQHK